MRQDIQQAIDGGGVAIVAFIEKIEALQTKEDRFAAYADVADETRHMLDSSIALIHEPAVLAMFDLMDQLDGVPRRDACARCLRYATYYAHHFPLAYGQGSGCDIVGKMKAGIASDPPSDAFQPHRHPIFANRKTDFNRTPV